VTAGSLVDTLAFSIAASSFTLNDRPGKIRKAMLARTMLALALVSHLQFGSPQTHARRQRLPLGVVFDAWKKLLYWAQATTMTLPVSR
jgi:hypothetical protein